MKELFNKWKADVILSAVLCTIAGVTVMVWPAAVTLVLGRSDWARSGSYGIDAWVFLFTGQRIQPSGACERSGALCPRRADLAPSLRGGADGGGCRGRDHDYARSGRYADGN